MLTGPKAAGATVSLVIFAFVLQIALSVQAKVNGRDPRWNAFVVGTVDELPEGPMKSFILDSHFRNPYAATIADKLKELGPFAPEANKVFWLPTIEMEMTPEKWRFLSSLEGVPEQILKTMIVERNGIRYLRMFLYPFSTLDPTFRKIASENGGFRYEFQGVTTASVRSLIAWKAEEPKPESGPGLLQFPKKSEDVLWVKVSIKSTNINGSRTNPLKKLVRASMVTKLMATIPDSVKKRFGFDFAGEWIAAVPASTDAGFVARQVLPDYTRENGAVEPAFSELSGEVLEAAMRGKDLAEVQRLIKEERFRPIARAAAYLLMEEGMFGEYHTQNFGYRKNEDGRLEDKVLLHDADAFRTNVAFRVMNGKDISPLREIETPFFFMKDTSFGVRGPVGDASRPNAVGLNSLLYLHLTDRDWSSPALVAQWCQGMAAFAGWCKHEELIKMLKEVLAEELSPYVKRRVSWEELRFTAEDSGNIGLYKLFRERVKILTATSPAVNGTPNESIQGLLRAEFARLYAIGSASLDGARLLDLENAKFFLNIVGQSASISAVLQKRGEAQMVGVAVLGTSSDPAAVQFARQIHEQTQMQIPMMEKHRMPTLRNVGGGSNRGRAPAPSAVAPICRDLFRAS